jgi:hypothetical protein
MSFYPHRWALYSEEMSLVYTCIPQILINNYSLAGIVLDSGATEIKRYKH